MTERFTLFVNSCDGFADCWTPFFALLQTHWPRLDVPIVLNTERTSWSTPGLDVLCTRVQGADAGRLTWSECLIRGLKQVQTPILLYMQEDYFIEAPVLAGEIERCVARMRRDERVAHIGLTDFGSDGPFDRTDDALLWRIQQRAPYRISLQAGLWRRDSLLSYLRADENAWMFELAGTRRAWKRRDEFLTVNRDLHRRPGSAVVSYEHTGINKGRWNPKVRPLFEEHGLAVDYSKRGFYRPLPRYLERLRTLRALASRPSLLVRLLKGG